MFLQASVILLTRGEYLTRYTAQDQVHPPRTRYTPPGPGTPPRPRTPPPPRPGTPPPPRPGTPPTRYTTPPQRRTCWEIRSTRGRYASYWNAILFYSVVCDVNVINSIRILWFLRSLICCFIWTKIPASYSLGFQPRSLSEEKNCSQAYVW